MSAFAIGQAQIHEDFNDGELLAGPTWMGDLDQFEVNEDKQLQLMGFDAGTAIIQTPLLSDSISFWEFDVKMDFAPSDGNQLVVYLWINDADLEEASGYFLQLGESGSDDRIRLFKLTHGNSEELATSSESFGEGVDLTIRIDVTNNQWRLASKLAEATGFTHQFTYADQDVVPPAQSDLFAISCTYTSTRRDLFFFDNILAQQNEPLDTVGPVVTDVEIIDSLNIIVGFSEALLPEVAEEASNYSIEPEGLQPTLAIFNDQENTVALLFAAALTPNVPYILVAGEIADLQGNLATSQFEFIYERAQEIKPYEILINEIYDDPTPSLGLPSSEYLEIFIRDGSDAVLVLDGLVLKNFDKEIALPPISTVRGSHLIICDQADSARFSDFGRVIAVDGLPTLLNSGNDLSIKASSGEILHQVSYNDTWYRDNSKDDGGWSLELINPDDPCALAENWSASTSLNGGTPGMPNSVLSTSSNPTEFQVQGIVPLEPDRILVDFNKSISKIAANQFSLVGGASEVIGAVRAGRNLEQGFLIIDPPLVPGTDYVLQFNQILECSGQDLKLNEFDVLIPHVPMAGEIVINEILFNPNVGGVDFIEIHNPTTRAFEISDLALATQTDQTQQIRPILRAAILPPGGHFVFTPDPVDIIQRYPPVDSRQIFRNPIPTMPDQGGNITLLYQGETVPRILDAIEFDEGFHSNILRNRDGVSLERIDANGTTQDRSNWHSASSESGFATPTRPNSQRITSKLNDVEAFILDPARLSPDGDGFEDFLTIEYDLATSGLIGHIRIFNSAGRLVKYLLNNGTLGRSGKIKWDGDTDDGGIAPIGIYTVLIETFDESGSQQRWKETCVVAGILD